MVASFVPDLGLEADENRFNHDNNAILLSFEDLQRHFAHDVTNRLAMHPRGFAIANGLYALI